MRIAFFTDSYLPNVDGVVTSLVGYRRELEKKGHTVYIFCPGSTKQKKENKDPNVYHFTSASFKQYPDYRLALFPFFSAVKRVKELKIDIIHSHGIATTGLAAIQASNKLNIPALASFHTLAPEGMHYITKNNTIQDFFKSVAWKYLKWYYSQFSNIIVPSNYIKKLLEPRGIKNMIVNPTGIDSVVYNNNVDSSYVRRKYKIKKNQPIILHVGRIALEKKIETLINSAMNVLNIFPDAKFIIVGKGPAKEHYEKMVKVKGLSNNFIFTGYVQDKDLPKYYTEADVFVFPSTFDTQGLVILESISVGTPAIVLKDSACAEFVDDGITGFHFTDHFDLPEKIVQAIKQKESLRKRTIKNSQKYTIQNSTKKLIEIYNSMISSP